VFWNEGKIAKSIYLTRGSPAFLWQRATPATDSWMASLK